MTRLERAASPSDDLPSLTTGLELETVVERRGRARGVFPMLSDMIVEKGTAADWELLHELHYKSEGGLFGPHYWRCSLHGETIGVMVISMPRGLLKDRHNVFPKLAPGGDTKMTNTYRYHFVNKNFRLVSRLVVDTMFRGIGVAYRMQNLASRMEGAKYIEIQSSMSKYNLFAEKAGFRFAKPRRANKYELGLEMFRRHFRAYPGDHQAIMQEIKALDPKIREKKIEELKAFYYQHSAMERTGSNGQKGTERVEALSDSALIRNLIQMCFSSPLYGVYANPDHGRQLPNRLPLTAFDNQPVTAPLDLEKIKWPATMA